MATMYRIINNEICEILDFSSENDGTAQGWVTLSQATAPDVGWTRVDENSEFTDTRPYQVKRQLAYPQIGEQLDKLYHDIENGTLTTSGDFYTALNTVKTDYPKS